MNGGLNEVTSFFEYGFFEILICHVIIQQYVGKALGKKKSMFNWWLYGSELRCFFLYLKSLLEKGIFISASIKVSMMKPQGKT